MDAVAKEMKEEQGLICTALGGSMPRGIEILEIEFTAEKCPTIEEARRLEVAATERLVQKINSHEAIRPYLKEIPFTHLRSLVSISFRNKDGVAFVFRAHNKIIYCGRDLDDLHVETYDEALKTMSEPH